MSDLPRLVADGKRTDVSGRWQRHVALEYVNQALDGLAKYGRWSTKDSFKVTYLGRPQDSVIVEAYRHLIDFAMDDEDRAGLLATMKPRALVTCEVNATNILDLRHVGTGGQLGLTPDELTSGTDDRAAYSRCQEVAQVAHQLGLHGLVTPAATKLGETLVLFPEKLPPAERPVQVGEFELWQQLPPDPRQNPGRHLSIVNP